MQAEAELAQLKELVAGRMQRSEADVASAVASLKGLQEKTAQLEAKASSARAQLAEVTPLDSRDYRTRFWATICSCA